MLLLKSEISMDHKNEFIFVGHSFKYVQIRHCHERSIVHEHVRERFTAVRDIPPKVKTMSFRAEFHMNFFHGSA